MRKYLLFLFFSALLSYSNSFSQAIGDYGTNSSGIWGTGYSWLVCTATGTWSGATTTTTQPGATTNVWIRATHALTATATSITCNNLTIQSGGSLTLGNTTTATGLSCNGNLYVDAGASIVANTPIATNCYISFYNVNATCQINGSAGDDTHGLGILTRTASEVLTITSSIASPGTAKFSTVRCNAASATNNSFIFDRDITLTATGSTGSGGVGLYAGGADGTIFTINAGKTVTSTDKSSVAIGSSQTTAPSAPTTVTNSSTTFNINGTLIIGSNGTLGNFNLLNAAGFTTYLNVGSTGVVNISTKLIANSTVAMNIAAGGAINFTGSSTGTVDASGAATTINGTFNFSNTGLSTRNLGTATVNGKLIFADNTYPTGITLNPGSTVEYQGASSYALPAAAGTYSNLTINNTVGNTLVAATAVTGTLTVSNGVLTTGGFLTLKSNAAGTAQIAPLVGSISGNVTVERYIPAGKRGFRFLTPAVTTTNFIKANWQEGATSSTANPTPNYGTHITGNLVDQTNGFDGTATGNASLFQFNNATQAWNTGIANTDATNLLAGNAYRLLIRGNRSFDLTTTAAANTATTLRATGSLTTGTVTINSSGVGATAGMPLLSGLASGYSLVGNPYASPINWSSVKTASTDLTGYYYIWDPTLGTRGAYVSCFTDGTKSNPASNVTVNIQSGQAIFVQNASTLTTGPSMTFQEAHKSTGNTNVFRTETGTSTLSAQLFLSSNLTNNNPQDAALVLYNSNYSNSVNDEDASKLTNQDENIAIQKGSNLMSIERRALPATPSDTLQFNMWQLTLNNYTIRITGSNFDPSINAYLQDSYLDSETLLNLNGSTDVNFTITSVTATMAADRFRIVFRSSGALPVSITNLKAYQKNTGVLVEWNTANELNMDSYQLEKSIDGSNFSKSVTVAATASAVYSWFDAKPVNGNNFYRIKMIDKNGAFKYSQTVNVKIGNGKDNFLVLGNPVKNQTIVLQLENVAKGNYGLKLYNMVGQLIAKQSIYHTGGSASQSFGIGNVAKGMYQLAIESESGNRFLQTIIVE